MSKTYVSAAEAAKRCDVSIASVRRKAHEKGLGVFVEGNSLDARIEFNRRRALAPQ